MELRTLDGNEPHPSHGGWQNFLDNKCEIRDEVDGVVFHGAVNCNYIVFPDGLLIQNYGYHGNALMSRVRREGWKPIVKQFEDFHQEMQDALGKLKMMQEKR
jgi:hypothetical protein